MVIESTSLRRGVGRRSLLSGVAATSALIASGGLPQVAGAQATPVVIKCLPIDRSTILAGSRFDLRVEVAGAQPDKIEVTVDGRDADAYFGTPGARTTEEGTIKALRVPAKWSGRHHSIGWAW